MTSRAIADADAGKILVVERGRRRINAFSVFSYSIRAGMISGLGFRRISPVLRTIPFFSGMPENLGTAEMSLWCSQDRF
jgi:hypothetical protein